MKNSCIAIVVALSQHSREYRTGGALKLADTVRHTVSILLQNEAGALARVANLFSTRGYNIESLNVAPTHDDTVSRLTLVTNGSETVMDQIIKQLGKLVDVVNIIDMTDDDHIERELALFKIQMPGDDWEPLARTAREFGATVLDDREGHFTVELTGGSGEIDRFVAAISARSQMLTVVRSGAMAVARGAPILTPT